MAQASWEEVVVTALACALRLYRAPDPSLLLHEEAQSLARGCIILRLRCFWKWLISQADGVFLRQNLLKCATPASTSCRKTAGRTVSVHTCVVLIVHVRIQEESRWQSSVLLAKCKPTVWVCLSIYFGRPKVPYGMLKVRSCFPLQLNRDAPTLLALWPSCHLA